LNFKKYPDYLFARLNYASILLLKGKFKEIPKLFNSKFDLKQFCPNRDTFHISEVLSFHKGCGLSVRLVKKTIAGARKASSGTEIHLLNGKTFLPERNECIDKRVCIFIFRIGDYQYIVIYDH
jgi:hypothetical protein